MIHIDFSALVRRVDNLGKVNDPDFDLEKGFRSMVRKLSRFSKKSHRYKNRTGLLSSSLRVNNKPTKGLVMSSAIESPVKYASYIYYGTKDHFIKPSKAKALSWVNGGSRGFSKGHKVSGIKKDEWIENNYKTRETFWNSILVRDALK